MNLYPQICKPADEAAARSRHGEYGIYRFFDVPVGSQLPLPELCQYQGSNPSVTVRQIDAPEIEPGEFETRYEWHDDKGRLICRCGRRDGDYLLYLPAQASFFIRAGGFIDCLAAPGVGPGLLRQLLLNQVLPRYLAHTGELLLHASAVTLPGGSTVAFLGDSGYGKSTLASFCHLQGAQMIDDDCILLRADAQGAAITGGVPTLRLYPDSLRALGHDPAGFAPNADGSGKLHMCLDESAVAISGARHLDALLLLCAPPEPDARCEVRLERAGGQAAMMSMLRSAFNLDPSDPQIVSGTFRRVAQALEQGLPIYHLHYPREHAVLPRVLEALKSFNWR
ncbi:MAG: hypothetical protein KDI33_03915 [Halioglobus sp.]|nr:hypothetical protein [Halioglobus sp.]